MVVSIFVVRWQSDGESYQLALDGDLVAIACQSPVCGRGGGRGSSRQLISRHHTTQRQAKRLLQVASEQLEVTKTLSLRVMAIETALQEATGKQSGVAKSVSPPADNMREIVTDEPDTPRGVWGSAVLGAESMPASTAAPPPAPAPAPSAVDTSTKVRAKMGSGCPPLAPLSRAQRYSRAALDKSNKRSPPRSPLPERSS